jgi:photosystem II stability/assembly factor-like uncharacterized protein
MKSVIRISILTIFVSPNIDALSAQWVRQNSEPNMIFADVVALDTATAIVVGKDGSILKTTNAGATWLYKLQPVDFTPWNSIAFSDSMIGIVVGDKSVTTTTNGGEQWSLHPLPGGRTCLSALQMGPNNVYVGDDSGWVHNSLDTGNTWTSEKISTGPIRALFAWRGTYALGFPIYALTPDSLHSKSEYLSGSWEETFLPFRGLGSGAFSGEFCNGGEMGFIVGVQGDLYAAPTIIRKSMSDSVWHTVSTGIQQGGTLVGVSAPSANVIYVCGSNGMIYKSSNGGDRWLDQSVSTRRILNAVHFFDENHGFAVGDSGLIFYTSNGGLTSVDDRGSLHPRECILEQNYPNPFNPVTTISFSLPTKSFVSLKVFDALGREVTVLLSEDLSAGTYSRELNATGLASGVYFCRLHAGNYLDTMKLILLR